MIISHAKIMVKFIKKNLTNILSLLLMAIILISADYRQLDFWEITKIIFAIIAGLLVFTSIVISRKDE